MLELLLSSSVYGSKRLRLPFELCILVVRNLPSLYDKVWIRSLLTGSLLSLGSFTIAQCQDGYF